MLGSSHGQVWTYSPEYRRPRHFHSEPELNLVVAGSATFGVGASVRVLGAGEVIGFTPGQDHELIAGSPDLVLFAIGLRRGLGNDVLRGSGEAVLAPFQARLSTADVAMLVARCSDTTGEDAAEQRVAELWQAAEAVARPARSVHSHTLTRRALAALDEAPELGREALAVRTRASVSEVGRYFLRDVGLTLVQYRSRLRLLRFVEHVDGGSSLTAAALDAGFGSYSQCHRVFSSAFACTPRDFFETERRATMEGTFVPVTVPRES